MEKRLVTGILAHVDAGKTTLSEGLLYTSGNIRKIGRVDNGDAFLDTNHMEKERGITIFSKQAEITYRDMNLTLLDTPGHVDFSAEMERVLQVLDYAILVISGADGVQGHTLTLWRLLKQYEVPVFLFINKMDQPGTDRQQLLQELRNSLSDGCIAFDREMDDTLLEEIAMEDEAAMNEFLETGSIRVDYVKELIVDRKIFPCYFGSALKLQGIEQFLEGMRIYTLTPVYQEHFGAKVFKITRDEQDNRLTHLKVTGGSLKVKDVLSNQENTKQTKGENWEEKVNQIRIYSGMKYKTVEEVEAGRICAVTGLNFTYPGEGLGCEPESSMPFLEPVLTYQMILPPEYQAAQVLPKLRVLEEEEPELHIIWNEQLAEIQVQIMGEVQIEILKKLILERFGIEVTFGTGNIVYKETIANRVEGVGHFEPLRHYAEVHLLLEPGEPGSGLEFGTSCSEEILDKNWQRLVLTHLEEKEHRGVLTGSAITDMRITLVSGRAHQKHTEGGDFRQATYRAVRQGLMQAESVLLEPFYAFRLEVPQSMVGRAMTDIEQMNGSFGAPEAEGEMSVLSGTAPVATMQNYQKEVTAYTKGLGKLVLNVDGYGPCHNTQEVLSEFHYEAERDLANTADSVFCAHGAGFVVPWNEVQDYMHVEGLASLQKSRKEMEMQGNSLRLNRTEELWIDNDEIDEIIARTFHANKHEKGTTKRWSTGKKVITSAAYDNVRPVRRETKEKYLLVDGYNVIFAWEELKELAQVNIDSARGKLLDILCDYQGIVKDHLIVVFDAYRVKGHQTEIQDYHNIHVVYTREAETADSYIEKFAHANGKKYDILVATSDGLEQIIITGQGCRLISAREFEKEVKEKHQDIINIMEEKKESMHNYLLDHAAVDTKRQLLETEDREKQ